MSAYVRVRKLEDLRRRIDNTGSTQTEVAASAGLSVQRLNQIYVGNHAVLEVRKAGRLEDVLKVSRGTLFVAIDGPLLVPYIDDEPVPPDDGPHQISTESVDDDASAQPPLCVASAEAIVCAA
jgi:hypothetical protein